MPLFNSNEVLREGRDALRHGFINPAGMVAWFLQLLVFTRPGVVLSVTQTALYLLDQNPDRPALALAAPFYLLPMGFLAFSFMIVGGLTDKATEFVFMRLAGSPDPQNLLHRVSYFALSLPVFVVLAFLCG